MIYNSKLSAVAETENKIEIEEMETEQNVSKNYNKSNKRIISSQKFNEEYIQPDLESAEWDKAVKSLMVSNNQKSLTSILASRNATLYTTDTNIYSLIKNFGMKDRNEKLINAQIRFLKNDPKVASVVVNGNHIEITKTDGTTISSMVLSETFNWDDGILGTQKQVSKSHSKSIDVASTLPTESVLVTGKVAGLTSKSSFLHSWVETTIDNKSVVIDYTMNAVINKSGYKSMRHSSSISRIDSHLLDHDIQTILPLLKSGELTLKEYLVHRETVMEALNENEDD